MRGKLLIILGVLVVLSLLLACAPATPQIIEVPKEVVIEKPVVQTVVVEKPVVVEKEKAATIVVEKTVVVEKEKKVEVVVTATPVPVKPKEPVKIVWWTDPVYKSPKTHPEVGDAFGAYEKMIAAEYTKMNPHVTIEVQSLDWADLPKKVPAAVAAGTPPDIMKDYLGRSSGYAYEGVLEDMNKLLPKEVIEDIIPGIRELYSIAGILHGFPAYFWEQHMIYNHALIEKAGLADKLPPIDNPDWTFEQFYELGKALKAANIGVEYLFTTQVANEQGDYAVHAFIWSAGSRTWKEDCSGLDLDNPKALAGMEFFNKLYKEGLINKDVTTAGWTDVENLFYTGKAVFMGGGLYNQGPGLELAKKEGRVTAPMDARMTMYPHAEGEKPAGLPIGPTGYFVFQKKDRKDYELQEIVNFLLYINGEKWLRDGCINSAQFPALKSVSAPLAGDPNYERALKWVQTYGVSAMGLQCPHFYEVRTALPAFWQAMVLGKMTPKEALDGMMAKSKEIMGK